MREVCASMKQLREDDGFVRDMMAMQAPYEIDRYNTGRTGAG